MKETSIKELRNKKIQNLEQNGYAISGTMSDSVKYIAVNKQTGAELEISVVNDLRTSDVILKELTKALTDYEVSLSHTVTEVITYQKTQ